MEYAPPAFDPPYRVLVLMASTDGWYAAPPDVREGALAQLAALFERTESRGARLVGSFDDDLFATASRCRSRTRSTCCTTSKGSA